MEFDGTLEITIHILLHILSMMPNGDTFQLFGWTIFPLMWVAIGCIGSSIDPGSVLHNLLQRGPARLSEAVVPAGPLALHERKSVGAPPGAHPVRQLAPQSNLIRVLPSTGGVAAGHPADDLHFPVVDGVTAVANAGGRRAAGSFDGRARGGRRAINPARTDGNSSSCLFVYFPLNTAACRVLHARAQRIIVEFIDFI